MRRCLPLLLAVTFIAPATAQQSGAQSELWSKIRNGLTGEGSSASWEILNHSVIPGGVNGLHTMKAIVVSSAPADHPTQLVLALSDDRTPEVTLELYGGNGKRTGLKKAVAAGTMVEFAGIAENFVREPFMLTLGVDLTPDRDTGLWVFDRETKKIERSK